MVFANDTVQRTLSLNQSDVATILENIPPFPLDISIAAHYMQIGNISSIGYVEALKKSSRDFIHMQNHILTMNGEYSDTRQGIINLSIQQIIESHEKFQEMLFFLSVIDSENIPRILLEDHYGEALVDNFIYQLKKHSFITKIGSIGNSGTFSIHESCKDQFLEYFKQRVDKKKHEELSHRSLDNFESFLSKRGKIAKSHQEFLIEKTLLRHARQMIFNLPLKINNAEVSFRSNLGERSMHVGDFPYAEKLLLDTIKISEELRNFSVLHDCYSSLGMVYVFLGSFEKANDSLKKAEVYWGKGSSKNPLEKAKILIFKGSAHRHKGDYGSAEESIQEGLHLYSINHNSPGIAWAKGYLGFVYNEQQQYEKAEKVLQEVLMFYEREGNDHKSAWIFHHLGYTFLFTKRYKEALELLKKSYAYYKNTYGKEYVNTAWIGGLLGLNYGFLGDFKTAREHLDYSFSVFKNHFGEEDPETITILQYIGIVEYLDHNTEKARNFLERSYQFLKKINHPKSKTSLLYLEQLSK